MLHHVVYASTALVPFSPAMLSHLLGHARKSNHARQITGIICYHERSFFSVLEGTEEVVQALFERVSADKRHTPQVLDNWEIPHRNFEEWRSAFTAPDGMLMPDGYMPLNTIVQDETFLRGADRKLFNRFYAGEWRPRKEIRRIDE